MYGYMGIQAYMGRARHLYVEDTIHSESPAYFTFLLFLPSPTPCHPGLHTRAPLIPEYQEMAVYNFKSHNSNISINYGGVRKGLWCVSLARSPQLTSFVLSLCTLAFTQRRIYSDH